MLRKLRIPIAVAAVLAIVGITDWVMAWPFERAVFLAPVLVVGVAALLGLIILWGKVIAQALRESRRPKLVLGLWIAGIGLIFLLTALGLKLPKGE